MATPYYTTISVDVRHLDSTTDSTGTLTAQLFSRLLLPNGSAVPPQTFSFAITNGVSAGILLPSTDVLGNVALLIKYQPLTPTLGAVVNLGSVVPPTTANTVTLASLLAATSVVPGVTLPQLQTTTTVAYTQASTPTQINVNYNAAFLVGMDVMIVNGASHVHGTVTAKDAGYITFQPYATLASGDTANGTVYPIGSTVSVVGSVGVTGPTGPQGIQGIQGIQGNTGNTGATGPSPITTTTGSYTQASAATSIAVTDSTAFAVGSDALLVNGANTIHGKITAKADSTHATFQPYASVPVGDTTNGTVYAAGSVLAAAGVQGATGAASGVSALSAGTGISVSGPTGSVTVGNTGVTSAVAGTGVSVSGATGAVTFSNTGVTSNVAGTGIGVSSATGASTITNTGVTSLAAGAGISLSGATGAVTVSSSTVGFSSGFKAHQSSTQGALSSGTWVKVLFQTNDYDGLSEYSTVNNRFTATAAGTYLFTTSVNASSLSSGAYYELALYVNGVQDTVIGTMLPNANSSAVFSGTGILKLAANDYVEVFAFFSVGSSVNASTQSTYFKGQRLL